SLRFKRASETSASRFVFFELQIDHFVMAITSFEARVRHRYPLMALARSGDWRSPLILLQRIPLPREGGGCKRKPSSLYPGRRGAKGGETKNCPCPLRRCGFSNKRTSATTR